MKYLKSSDGRSESNADLSLPALARPIMINKRPRRFDESLCRIYLYRLDLRVVLVMYRLVVIHLVGDQ